VDGQVKSWTYSIHIHQHFILIPYYSKEHYDRGVNTFSPEGRIYQIEYAIEAIKVRYSLISLNKTWLKFGSTAIGVRTNEGVVLGVEKKFPSKLMEPAKSEKLIEVIYLMIEIIE
jgi:20S proteasome subunit alpha 5